MGDSTRGSPPAPPSSPLLGYNPAIDGIRLFCVLCVMCSHMSVVQPILKPFGSYLAVDGFFVISGYLITTLLIREHAAFGRLSLRAFYLRRFTRLYPLIVAVLVICGIQIAVAPHASATPSGTEVAGIAAYFYNFVLIGMGANGLHTWGALWSLSIEEQFYAIWPIVLVVVLRTGRRRWRPFVVVMSLTIAMWIWRFVSFHGAVERAASIADAHQAHEVLLRAMQVFYYSTLHRPDGLLIGAAVAVALAWEGSTLSRGLAQLAHRGRLVIVFGIGLIISASALTSAPWQIYWGLALFNVLVALLLVELVQHPTSRFAGVFAFKPFVWGGRRSYFIYVFHVAVLRVTILTLSWTSLPGLLLAALIIFVLAGISYRFYEAPIRRWGQQRSRSIVSRADPEAMSAGSGI